MALIIYWSGLDVVRAQPPRCLIWLRRYGAPPQTDTVTHHVIKVCPCIVCIHAYIHVYIYIYTYKSTQYSKFLLRNTSSFRFACSFEEVGFRGQTRAMKHRGQPIPMIRWIFPSGVYPQITLILWGNMGKMMINQWIWMDLVLASCQTNPYWVGWTLHPLKAAHG